MKEVWKRRKQRMKEAEEGGKRLKKWFEGEEIKKSPELKKKKK